MGTAGGRIARHCPGRHPAARADDQVAVAVTGLSAFSAGIEIFLTARIRPSAGPPGSTCPAGRATWPRPGAPSGSACSSPTAARPPGALAAAYSALPADHPAVILAVRLPSVTITFRCGQL